MPQEWTRICREDRRKACSPKRVQGSHLFFLKAAHIRLGDLDVQAGYTGQSFLGVVTVKIQSTLELFQQVHCSRVQGCKLGEVHLFHTEMPL